jgi:hypothetical protein
MIRSHRAQLSGVRLQYVEAGASDAPFLPSRLAAKRAPMGRRRHPRACRMVRIIHASDATARLRGNR